MLPFSALDIGVLSFIVVRAIVEEAALATLISWTAILVVAAGVWINFFWFHYVTIDANQVRAVRCLGFLRRSTPPSEIESVGTRPQTSAYRLLKPTLAVRLNLQNSVLEFGQAYEPSILREALLLLVRKGIPVDARLLKEFSLGHEQTSEARQPGASDQ